MANNLALEEHGWQRGSPCYILVSRLGNLGDCQATADWQGYSTFGVALTTLVLLLLILAIIADHSLTAQLFSYI